MRSAGAFDCCRDVATHVITRGEEIRQHDDFVGAKLDAACESVLDIGVGKLQEGRDHAVEVADIEICNPLRERANFVVGGLFSAAMADH